MVSNSIPSCDSTFDIAGRREKHSGYGGGAGGGENEKCKNGGGESKTSWSIELTTKRGGEERLYYNDYGHNI